MALQFIITDAGRAAIAQVGGAIGPVTLTKIAIGSAGYTPTASRIALQTEIKRLDPSGSTVPVPGTIHMTAQDDSADSYSVKEIGLYTNNSVLFAIYSQSTAIITKGSTASALFALDFVMTNVPAGTVVVGDAGFSYAQANETRLGVLAIATTAEAQAGTIDTKIITPLKLAQVTATETRRGLIELATTAEAQALAPDATKALTVARLVDRTATTGRAGVVVFANSDEVFAGTNDTKSITPKNLRNHYVQKADFASETESGIIEIATSAETQTGTDALRAVTPAGLASRTATTARAGIVALATSAETQTGTDANKAVTPAGLAARTATDARAGIVELATSAETQTGTDALRAVTPAGLASAAALFVPPGAVMPFAMTTAPSGWLAANGQTIGSAASGANFGNPNYSDLFGVLWANWSNTLLPIQTSTGAASTRGLSAAADFASNKRLPLPDLRGYFVRGSGTNTDGTASGAFGTKQADAFQGHRHGAEQTSTFAGPTGTAQGSDAQANNSTTGDPVTDTVNGPPRTASETRPKNIALLYCIKF
jgi:hypothetical protein